MSINYIVYGALVVAAIGPVISIDTTKALSSETRKWLDERYETTIREYEVMLDIFFSRRADKPANPKERLMLRLVLEIESARRDAYIKAIGAAGDLLLENGDGNPTIVKYPKLLLARARVRALHEAIRATSKRPSDSNLSEDIFNEYLYYVDERLRKSLEGIEAVAKKELEAVPLEDQNIWARMDSALSRRLMRVDF